VRECLLGHEGDFASCKFCSVIRVVQYANAAIPKAASLAGAEGAAAWQEQIMTAAHILPSTGVIIAFGVLVYGVFAQKKDTKTKQ
jgi:hypothetical protein